MAFPGMNDDAAGVFTGRKITGDLQTEPDGPHCICPNRHFGDDIYGIGNQ
jgi:hypothetical protein